jgi:hypothetical protein
MTGSRLSLRFRLRLRVTNKYPRRGLGFKECRRRLGFRPCRRGHTHIRENPILFIGLMSRGRFTHSTRLRHSVIIMVLVVVKVMIVMVMIITASTSEISMKTTVKSRARMLARNKRNAFRH